jgi:hypothetical protein
VGAASDEEIACPEDGGDFLDELADDLAGELGRNREFSRLVAEHPEWARAWKELRPIGLETDLSWLSSVSKWLREGVEVSGNGFPLKFIHNGQEIANMLGNNRLLPIKWNEGPLSGNFVAVDQLTGCNYKLTDAGSDIVGDVEFVKSPSGALFFKRSYTPGCGAIVNFSSPPVKGGVSLQDFDPNLGFSGVFDVNTNKFILHPSADNFGISGPVEEIFYRGGDVKIEYDFNEVNNTTFQVNRNGGHITGNNVFNQIFNTIGDDGRAGFAIIYIDPTTLKINFTSQGLNPKFHPPNTPDQFAKTLPVNLQNQVLLEINRFFPGYQIIQ